MVSTGTGEHERALTALVATVALLALTVCLAAVVLATVGSVPLGSSPPQAAFELEVDAASDRVALEHVAGDPLPVNETSLVVAVNGEALAFQPPVPFFSADGFRGGPTGPINPSWGPTWRPGDTGSFRLASTNRPPIDEGDRVAVTVAVDGRTVVRLESVAR